MNTLPRLAKVLGFLLIFLLLVPFTLGAVAVAAPNYIDLIIPILLVVLIAFGIGLYFNSRRKKPATA